MKFKIIKNEEWVDGSDSPTIFYTIFIKRWLFWKVYVYYNWGDDPQPKKFDTLSDAEHHIKYFLAPKKYVSIEVKEITYN